MYCNSHQNVHNLYHTTATIHPCTDYIHFSKIAAIQHIKERKREREREIEREREREREKEREIKRKEKLPSLKCINLIALHHIVNLIMDVPWKDLCVFTNSYTEGFVPIFVCMYK